MKLHKAIPLALAWNRLNGRHMAWRQHVKVSGNPLKLSVVTVDGLLEIQTDHESVGDWIVEVGGLKGFKAKDKLAAIDGRLCRVNGLEIPLVPFTQVDDLPTIDTTGFVEVGTIFGFRKAWNLACDHASDEPSRYALQSVAISHQMDLSATNGQILFATKVANFEKAILVPLDPARIIGSVDGDLTVSFKEAWVQLATDEVRLITRVMEGEFPNIQNVVPTSNVDLQFCVYTAAWVAAWKAVKAHPDSEGWGVLDVNDGVVTVRPPQKGDKPTSITIPAQVTGQGRRTLQLVCDNLPVAIPGDTLDIRIHHMSGLKDQSLWEGPVEIVGTLGLCLVMTTYLEKSDDKDIQARLAALGDH